MALTDAKRCKAISKRTGKQCQQPAMTGFEVCRFHGANPGSGAGRPKGSVNPPRSRKGGATKENINSHRHGAYSMRLLPEEELIYQEKRKAFTDALGAVDVFDEQILHLLSLTSTKVDQAVMKGAEHAAYAGMIKQILDLLRELKATRASCDAVTGGRMLTYADLVVELKALIEKEGNGDAGEKKPQPQTEQQLCSRCLQEAWHELKEDGEWECQNCGLLTEAEAEAEPEQAAAATDAEQ